MLIKSQEKVFIKQSNKIFIYVLGLNLLLMIISINCTIFSSEKYRYQLDEPELKPFATMHEVNREEYCLTEIDPDAVVEIERDIYASSGYHVMLHIYSPGVARTVAFIEENNQYVWIGEQEVHRSGNTYLTADGESDEEIVVTYHKKKFSDMIGFYIDYLGDYETGLFSVFEELTCEQVKPYIKAWDEKAKDAMN